MANPRSRGEIPGGRYHVTARGNERRDIFRDDRDRAHFLELLEELPERFGVLLHSYALMRNHFHLVLETPEANLSRTGQWLNVSYSVWFNRRHERSGHLFQGRFGAVIMKVVGSAKGERWEEFRDRHGDWGRDAALWLGRRAGRMTLGQLAVLAGGVDYTTVGAAVSRFGRRLARDRKLSRIIERCVAQLSTRGRLMP